MNQLDLPPRRPLPDDVRTRIREALDADGTDGTERVGRAGSRPAWSRAPAAVAAGVAVLAVGAAVIAQSVAGTPDGYRLGAAPPSSSTVSSDIPVPLPLAVTRPDARTTADLDRCGAVVAASPREHEFAPRSAWSPVFTATAPDGTRFTAYREYGDKPGFCVVDENTATVTDPSAETMPLGTGAVGAPPSDVYGLYLSPSGVLVGVAQGVDALRFSALTAQRDDTVLIAPTAPPVLRDELFVVNVGELAPGDSVSVVGRNSAGHDVLTGSWTYDPATLRPSGATGPA